MLNTKNIIIALFSIIFLCNSTLSFAKDASKSANKESQVVEHGWAKRCPENKDTKKKATSSCEIFQLISVKKSKMRVAEFAIGFPNEKGLPKGTARGVVILPLGILLEQGITMTIDDGKPATFQARFCINAGCFSFINLDKKIINKLKKGNKVKFHFKVSTGQDVNLIMSLKNFSKVLRSIS